MRPDAATFLGRLRATAAADPARIAVAGTGLALTYGNLAGRIARMAGWLHRAGLAPGQMCGLTLRDDLAHLVVALALMRLGCHQVTLASHEPAAMRADIARRAGVVAVLADRAEDAMPGLPCLLPDHAEAAGDAGLAALVPAEPTALPLPLLVLTSSGTTGRPKLVPLSEPGLLAQSVRRRGLGRVRHRPIGLEYNNGKRFPLFALANGDTHVLAEASRGIGLEAVCRRFGVAMLGLAPHQAETLLARERPVAWPAATRIDLAGAAPGDGLVQRLKARLTPEVYVLYGTTEVGSVARAGPAEHAACPEGSGLVFPTVEVAIVDDRGTPLPPGATGLIRIRATGMAERYLDDPEATARAFVGGWFQPGDMGRLLPDGTLVVSGRADDMMMLGTVNIFPAEIERVAAAFPGVAECAAFALRSPALGDIPVIAIVAEPGATPDAAALLAHCRQRLGLRAPRKAVMMAALPRTRSGKVMRHELAAMAARG
ncbi:class I adenylate-forming enzyme family protein [Roseomonas sp. HF4]|uniref:class I adenylate-forming enzyme family protein n=1 Tax=Roseomonas sp. HF4 TaxID=2562313 RepID=UPI0010BF78BE|nr:class I adenylate-forming enzyme family protein [Roseomonas sp. HF4]